MVGTIITLYTTKRQEARNKFEEDFYKFLNNCVHGKTCESKRKGMLVRLKNQETAKHSISKTKKLLQNLCDKSNYIILCKFLQL